MPAERLVESMKLPFVTPKSRPHTFFSSKDTDWSGNILAGWKQIREEVFKMEVSLKSVGSCGTENGNVGYKSDVKLKGYFPD